MYLTTDDDDNLSDTMFTPIDKSTHFNRLNEIICNICATKSSRSVLSFLANTHDFDTLAAYDNRNKPKMIKIINNIIFKRYHITKRFHQVSTSTVSTFVPAPALARVHYHK